MSPFPSEASYCDNMTRLNPCFKKSGKKVKWIEGASPANKLKAIKNETELNGFRAAVVRDGVALTKFYYWLETALHAGEAITELDASRKLTALRSEQQYYLMDSFESISR